MEKKRVLIGVDRNGIDVATVSVNGNCFEVDVRRYDGISNIINKKVTGALDGLNVEEINKLLKNIADLKVEVENNGSTVAVKEKSKFKYIVSGQKSNIPFYILGAYTIYSRGRKMGRQLAILSSLGEVAYVQEKNFKKIVDNSALFKDVVESDMSNFYFSKRGNGEYVVCKKPGSEFLVEKDIDLIEFTKIIAKSKKNFEDKAEPVENKKDSKLLNYTDDQLRAIMKAKEAGVNPNMIKGKNLSSKQIMLLTVAHKHRLPELERLLSEAIVDEITSKMIFAEGVAGFNKELEILVRKYNEVVKTSDSIKKDIDEYKLSDTKVAAFIDVIENKNLSENEIEKLADEIIYGSNMDAVNLANM